MRRNSIRSVIFMALCLALNIIASNIALLLKLPLYLDAIGTIFAACVLGPAAGMIVGGSTGILVGVTTDIFSLFFMPVQLILGAMAGFIFRKKQSRKLSRCWWQAIAISLPGTLVSTLITVILFHGITSSGSSLIVQFLTGIGMDQALSVFVVQVGTDYLDRLLTVFLVSVATQLVGNRLPSSRW